MATHHETYFSRSLNELLQRRFDGNKAALAKASGIDRAVISVLAKPSIAPSTQRLEALGDCLPKEERLRLFLATAKDVMPKKYQSEVTKTASWDEASELPEDLAVVLGHLREQALLDADPQSASDCPDPGRRADRQSDGRDQQAQGFEGPSWHFTDAGICQGAWVCT